MDQAGEVFTTNDKPAYDKTAGPATTDIGTIDVILLRHNQHGDWIMPDANCLKQ